MERKHKAPLNTWSKDNLLGFLPDVFPCLHNWDHILHVLFPIWFLHGYCTVTISLCHSPAFRQFLMAS